MAHSAAQRRNDMDTLVQAHVVNIQPPVPEIVCRVCGAGDVRLLCQTANEHSRTHILDNYRCVRCGSVFIGNRIGPQELTAAYSTLDEQAYYERTAAASAQKFDRAAEDLAKLVPLDAEVLDIGGGNGAFARALARKGFRNISLHEIPGDEIAGLSGVVRKIYRDADYTTLPASGFDAVTLMDVMEHVPDPATTVAAVKRVLRPGGVVYLHTPVVTVLDRLMHLIQRLPVLGKVGRSWQRARTSIFHLQNYTPHSLSLLMQRGDLAIERLTCITELSWPLALYVRVYFVEKAGLPKFLLPVAMLAAPVLRSPLNRNKGVVVARKASPNVRSAGAP
jgi:SAM-dependent methyltransferase